MLRNNLKCVFTNEDETIFHYDEALLKANLVFEERTEIDEVKADTVISLKHFNQSDAFHFTLYEGSWLSPIQTLRILSDVVELYQDNTLNVFLGLIDDLSIGSMTALSQSTEERQEEIRDWIKQSFVEVLQSKS